MERRISIGDALAAFHQDRAISCAPSTVALQRRILRPLEGSERPVLAYDGILCRELLLAKSHVQPNTRMTAWVALSAFGRWLAEQQFLPANPMEGVPKPRVTESPHRYLTPEEIRRLFAVLGQGKRDTETRLILWLLLEGLRASELCNLRWQDVRSDRIVIAFAKGGKVRAIPLRPAMSALLEARRQSPLETRHAPQASSETREPHTRNTSPAQSPHSHEARHMVYGSGDRPLPSTKINTGRIFAFSSDALRHRIALLGRRAGIPGVHCHLFRHSMASLSLLAGMNPEHLRAVGGWSAKSEVWERYVRSVREDAAIKAALELDLSGRIFGE